MKKISTLFKKNPEDLGKVINEINTDNEWVLKFGIPTQKFDGTSCAIIEGELYKRFDLKPNRTLPINLKAIPCQMPDEITGHHPHWIECEKTNNADKYYFEAFDLLENKKDGTYELCGQKVQGNPENIEGHKLIKHGCNVLDIKDFSFDSLKSYLEAANMEGIVFHSAIDDRMCKIRKSDFGIKRFAK